MHGSCLAAAAQAHYSGQAPIEQTMQIPQLAYQIAEYIKSERLPEGTRLPGRKLAEQFRVSRSPIERALRLLEEHKVVSSSETALVVETVPASISPEALGAQRQSQGELLYLRLAEDHATSRLPEKMSENELMRRYGASRAMILRTLQRAASEGWAERLAGTGLGVHSSSDARPDLRADLPVPDRHRACRHPGADLRARPCRRLKPAAPSRWRCLTVGVWVSHRWKSSTLAAGFTRWS